MTIENNIPAFPMNIGVNDAFYEGMTLLDYFAAKAMQGLLSSSTIIGNQGQTFFQLNEQMQSGLVYGIAAAMLEERKKYIPEGKNYIQ